MRADPIRRHRISPETRQETEIAPGRPISARMPLNTTQEEMI